MFHVKPGQTDKAMRARINAERKTEMKDLLRAIKAKTITFFVPDWDRGECRGVTPEIAEKFHPDTGEAAQAYRIIREYCEHCDIRRQCLIYALITQQDYGIWGGTTATMRRNSLGIKAPSKGGRSAKVPS